MFFLLLAVSLSTSAALQAAPASEHPPIIVTGQKIRDAKANLRDCIARNCPPDEEIDAALALAEAELLAGEYRDARTTLLASLKRNKDEAARYPIPVSDLYRANGKVAAHLGYDNDYYRSTWGIYQTLKKGMPSAIDRKFSALMEVAEMTYRTRGHERARLYYESIAKQAREAGRPDIAAIAELRSAIRHLPPGSVWQVDKIRRIASLNSADMRAPALEANVALARMSFEKGDEQGAQNSLKNLAHLNIQRPILVYVPPFEVEGGQTGSGETRHAGGLNDHHDHTCQPRPNSANKAGRMCDQPQEAPPRTIWRSTSRMSGWMSASGSRPMAGSPT